MALKERQRQLRVVGEILTVHIPQFMDSDPDLVKDLLSVVGTALSNIHEDAEASADAWDKRAYHVRADRLRREWEWALPASNYALGLALRPHPVTPLHIQRLKQLIRPGVEKPARRQITDPMRFRAAAQAIRRQQARKRKPIRG